MIVVRLIMQLWARRRGDEGSLWRVADKRDSISPPAGPRQNGRADPHYRRVRDRVDRHQRHQLYRRRRLCPCDADRANRERRSGRYSPDEPDDSRAADHGGFHGPIDAMTEGRAFLDIASGDSAVYNIGLAP